MAKTLVQNARSLTELLEKRYGSRFVNESLLYSTTSTYGSIDSKKFYILFENDYLLISTPEDSKDILNELQPLLTEVMNGKNPILSYDLQIKNEIMPTIEWDINAPENRIKEVVNGRAFLPTTKIYNIKLLNGKDIQNYLETKEEKEERIKNTRIYGIDKGCIQDENEVDKLSEVELYFLVYDIGKYIWACRHEMHYGRISEVDLTEEEYALEYLVYKTTKFGVELPEPEIYKHITPTPSYYAWYNFYNNHFEKFTSEKWDAFNKARENNEDVSAYMPSGHWTDLLEKTNEKNLTI